jgi:hypothetical protein
VYYCHVQHWHWSELLYCQILLLKCLLHMCSNAFWWTGGNRMFCIIQHGLWRDLLCYGNRLITYIVTPTFNIPPSALWLGDVMTCSPPTSITRQQKLFSRSMTSCFACRVSDSDGINLKPESMLTLCIGMHVFVAVCFYRTSSRLQSMVYWVIRVFLLHLGNL